MSGVAERVLLDTDIFSEVLKGRDENVVRTAREYLGRHGRFTFSVITAMEIASGLRRKQAGKQLISFEEVLARSDVIPLDVEAGLRAAAIDAALRLRGTPVGLSDVMIASIALRHGYPLVTGNISHFEAIRAAGFSLQIENWRL